MGWTPVESRIEELRERIGEDPATAVAQIRAEISRTTSPSQKTYLYGLEMAAARRCGQAPAAWRAYKSAKALRATALACAELEAQAASLSLWGEQDLARAALHLEAAFRSLDGVTSTGDSGSAKRRRQAIRIVQAGLLTIEGQLALATGAGRAAIAVGLEVLERLQGGPLAARVRLAAVTVIGRAVPKYGTAKELATALAALCAEEEALLRRRSRTVRSLVLCQVRWCRALILARFGSTRKAQRLLLTVIDDLDRIGVREERDRAVASLLWVIEEREGESGRALYMARKLQARNPCIGGMPKILVTLDKRS